MIGAADLRASVLDAVVNTVLRGAEKAIKEIRCDTSAIAPQHLEGYEAGFRAAKRAALDALAD